MTSLIARPLRAAILAAADNTLVRQGVTRYGMRLGARRFVAGETMAEFLPVAQAAMGQRFAVSATILGESIGEARQTDAVADEYCELLSRFAEARLDATVAFKLTQLGLDVAEDLALQNARRIAAAAAERANTVRIDMEQSRYVDATLRMYRRLREERDNVGLALQSYLYRSYDDLRAMLALSPNLRIVKGAYLEPAAVAYSKKSDVDKSYLRLVELAFSADGYTAVATHDSAIIEQVISLAARRALPKQGRFEFELLYGIGEPVGRELLRLGYRVRLLISYGSHWFGYLMRRLAERPANLTFFLRNLLAIPSGEIIRRD
ncbi:MAG: proline dehydrogenase family protein [Candidatus Eremiobacteraeota bacterium]|nr:proline dehydrogenase family protein [Candidatus Eremiobacteraeota bacterium]